MRKGRRAALLTAGFAFCVAGAVLNHHATANADREGRIIEGITGEDVHNTFTSNGIKREAHQARVFIIKRGDPGGVIEGFKVAGGDKLRIDGFGLTKAEAVMALMHQQDSDSILALPDGPVIKLLDTRLESLREDNFQLELDRSNLVESFADDFNSFSWYAEGLSPQKDRHGTWRTHYGTQGVNGEGSRSFPGELQVYADTAFKGTASEPLGLNPFHITDGILEIWAEPAPERVAPFIWGRRYTSGLITSKYSFSQLYGVFEIRARLPKGRGYWPAFWLLPTDSSWPPEIDVLEVLGDETTKLYASAHSKAEGEHTAAGIEAPVPDLSSNFHRYTVEWQKDYIIWYLDGVEIERAPTPADMHKPMYLLANLTIGGWHGGPDSSTRFPGIYAIDYIRAYRRHANVSNP
jgi:hypothetical protein